MILSSKSFTTNIARIRTFISVGPLVDEQIVGFGKLSIAKFTNKLLSWSVGSIIYRRFTDVAQSLSYWRRQDCGWGVSRIVVDVMKTFLTGTGGRHVAGSVLEMSGECLNSIWNRRRTVHWGSVTAGSFGHWRISWERKVRREDGTDRLKSGGIRNLHLMRVESASWCRRCHGHGGGGVVTELLHSSGRVVPHYINYFFRIHLDWRNSDVSFK